MIIKIINVRKHIMTKSLEAAEVTVEVMLGKRDEARTTSWWILMMTFSLKAVLVHICNHRSQIQI